jgi:hypothetical protein
MCCATAEGTVCSVIVITADEKQVNMQQYMQLGENVWFIFEHSS